MSDFNLFGIYGILERHGQPLKRAQVFFNRWIAIFRESTLAGCHWELKDARFWPKWLSTTVPLCLFALTMCVMGYGWQSVIMTKWHATSTYHRQLALAAYSQRLRSTRHDEWTSQRKAIHRQWLTLLDKLSAPVSPMETLTRRAEESGLVLRHLMPLEKEGRQSYSLLLEGQFNGIMKFLLDPVGKSIWTMDAMTIEFAPADSPIGSVDYALPSSINSKAVASVQKTSIRGKGADEKTNLLAKGNQLLSLAVVVSWIEPRLLASALSSKQADIHTEEQSTHIDLLNKGTALLDQLTHGGFDKPRLNPFEKRLGLSAVESPDISSVTSDVHAYSTNEATAPHHAHMKRQKDNPEVLFLGTFSDQWGRKALVKVGENAPCIVDKGALIPTLKLKVIAVDKRVLILEHADGTRVTRVLKYGLGESVNHE